MRLIIKSPYKSVIPILVLLFCFQAGSKANAGEFDFYLPEDTAVYSSFNFKHLLNSPLIKKHGVQPLKELLKENPEIKAIFDDIGFDPFKDLDRLISASPVGNEAEKGFVIVHGNFNPEKLKSKAEDYAKANPEFLKISRVNDGKGGQFSLYEFNATRLQALIYFAMPDEKTILASAGKDLVVDAMRRKEKAKLKHADFQVLLEKMSPKQTLSIAMMSEALKGRPEIGELGKQIVDGLEAIGGGITLGDEIEVELAGNAKSLEKAKELTDKINDSITKGLGILALFASQDRKLAPLVDVLKTVKAQNKEKSVVLKMVIANDLVEKTINEKDKP